MQRPKKAFTLIELLVAITILAVIMLSILAIYSDIVGINKRLEYSRIINENSRNIIETFASQIRQKWINYNSYTPLMWWNIDYEKWNNILYANPNDTYCLKKTWADICDASCYTDPYKCYLGKIWNDIKLNDERVVIKNLKFFIYPKIWHNSAILKDREWRVTLVFDMEIAPSKSVTESGSTVHIQTTINETIYKNINN